LVARLLMTLLWLLISWLLLVHRLLLLCSSRCGALSSWMNISMRLCNVEYAIIPNAAKIEVMLGCSAMLLPQLCHKRFTTPYPPVRLSLLERISNQTLSSRTGDVQKFWSRKKREIVKVLRFASVRILHARAQS
jgi:hypothetical protein